MYKIVLVCENGASTGLCMRKMIEYAKNSGIDCQIDARAIGELATFVADEDILLFAPQIGYRLPTIKKNYPLYERKFSVINSMDFGMMDGKKIVDAAISLIEKNKLEEG